MKRPIEDNLKHRVIPLTMYRYQKVIQYNYKFSNFE